MKKSERLHPGFVQGIQLGIAHWGEQARQLDHAGLQQLDRRRHNLYQMLEHGVRVVETWPTAVDVVLASFPLAEQRGYWQEWLVLIDIALENESPAQTERRVRLLNHKGQFLRFLRRVDEAIATHETAVALAKTVSPLLQAQTEWSLVVDYLESNRLTEAVTLGERVLAALREQDVDDWWLVQILRPLGSAEARQGNLQAARTYHLEAVERARTLTQDRLLAFALNELAQTLLWSGMEQDALRCYEEAITLLADTGSEFDKAVININLGSLYYNQRQLADAEAAFRRADTEYLRRSEHLHNKAILDNNLGNVLRELGKLDEAEIYLRRALTVFPQLGDEVGWGNALGSLARVLKEQGQSADAVPYLQEAIERLSRHPENSWGQSVLKKLRTLEEEILDEEE